VAGGRGAERCANCGECEPKCPQEIPIQAKLDEAHAHLMNP
jgi:predicted aldo/keto reductase-like oxidoreductase